MFPVKNSSLLVGYRMCSVDRSSTLWILLFRLYIVVSVVEYFNTDCSDLLEQQRSWCFFFLFPVNYIGNNQ